MAKKSGGGSVKKIDVVDLCAYVALVLVSLLFVVGAILKAFNIPTNVLTIFNTIKDISVILALALGGYSFTRGKGKFIKILFYIAVIIYIVALIMNISIL